MAKTRLTYIYNTDALCKYRMDFQDMAIMDWIYSFVTSGKMATKRIYDSNTKSYSTYWWLYYQALIDDYYNKEYSYTPLGITNRQVLARHIKSLADRHLLDFRTESFVNYGREKSEKGCYTMIRINLIAFGELTGSGNAELIAASFRNEKGEEMNVKEYSAFKAKKEAEERARKEKKRLSRPGVRATREFNRPKVNGSYGFNGKNGPENFVSLYNASMYNEINMRIPECFSPEIPHSDTAFSPVSSPFYSFSAPEGKKTASNPYGKTVLKEGKPQDSHTWNTYDPNSQVFCFEGEILPESSFLPPEAQSNPDSGKNNETSQKKGLRLTFPSFRDRKGSELSESPFTYMKKDVNGVTAFSLLKPDSQRGLDKTVRTDIRTLENRFSDDSELFDFGEARTEGKGIKTNGNISISYKNIREDKGMEVIEEQETNSFYETKERCIACGILDEGHSDGSVLNPEGPEKDKKEMQDGPFDDSESLYITDRKDASSSLFGGEGIKASPEKAQSSVPDNNYRKEAENFLPGGTLKATFDFDAYNRLDIISDNSLKDEKVLESGKNARTSAVLDSQEVKTLVSMALPELCFKDETPSSDNKESEIKQMGPLVGKVMQEITDRMKEKGILPSSVKPEVLPCPAADGYRESKKEVFTPDAKTADDKAEPGVNSGDGDTLWIREFLASRQLGLEAESINPVTAMNIWEKAVVFGLDTEKKLKAYILHTIKISRFKKGLTNIGAYVLYLLQDERNIRSYIEDTGKRNEAKKQHEKELRYIKCPVCGNGYDRLEGKCCKCSLGLIEDSREVCYRRVLFGTDPSLLKKYDSDIMASLTDSDALPDLDSYSLLREGIRMKYLPQGENDYRRTYVK